MTNEARRDPSIPERWKGSPPVVWRLLVASLALVLGCSSSRATPAMSPSGTADSNARVYLLARLEVRDFARFQTEYGAKVAPLLARAGARVLVASPSVDVREGAWEANWTVVIEFPSRAAAMSFYESTDYQPLKRLRQSLTRSGNLVFVEGFVPPTSPNAATNP